MCGEERMMNFERIWICIIEVHSLNFLGRIEENHEHLRISGVPSDIRTDYLTNTNLEP
jgi:hypothetical protein